MKAIINMSYLLFLFSSYERKTFIKETSNKWSMKGPKIIGKYQTNTGFEVSDFINGTPKIDFANQAALRNSWTAVTAEYGQGKPQTRLPPQTSPHKQLLFRR